MLIVLLWKLNYSYDILSRSAKLAMNHLLIRPLFVPYNSY